MSLYCMPWWFHCVVSAKCNPHHATCVLYTVSVPPPQWFNHQVFTPNIMSNLVSICIIFFCWFLIVPFACFNEIAFFILNIVVVHNHNCVNSTIQTISCYSWMNRYPGFFGKVEYFYWSAILSIALLASLYNKLNRQSVHQLSVYSFFWHNCFVCALNIATLIVSDGISSLHSGQYCWIPGGTCTIKLKTLS